MKRVASLGVLAMACGPAAAPHGPTPPGALPPSAAVYPATRWVPDKPTYVMAAKSMTDFQGALASALDTLGLPFGGDAREAEQALQDLIATDPLSADAMSALGVDLSGGVAMFSEDVDPTFVVKLAAPDAFAQFIDQQRGRGLVTRSVQVDSTELFTASLGGGAAVSWAIDQGWLWVHFRLLGSDDTSWFTHSAHPAGASWSADWAWAERAGAAAAKRVVGWIGARDLFATIGRRVPAALACVKLAAPIGRVALDLDGDLAHATVGFTIDLGGDARAFEQHILPPPPGWAAAAAQAPLSVQWNLDLDAVAQWVAPCAAVFGENLAGELHGFRAARALLQTFDPDAMSGTGVVAVDASSTRLFAQLLDQIPLRSTLESSRKFGPWSGKHLSIPFKGAIDYVLTDHLAIAAMGDGMLERIATGTSGAAPPVMAIDLLPPKLPAATWAWLLEAADIHHPKRVVEHLQAWSEAHLDAVIDHDSLVIQLSGKRR